MQSRSNSWLTLQTFPECFYFFPQLQTSPIDETFPNLYLPLIQTYIPTSLYIHIGQSQHVQNQIHHLPWSKRCLLSQWLILPSSLFMAETEAACLTSPSASADTGLWSPVFQNLPLRKNQILCTCVSSVPTAWQDRCTIFEWLFIFCAFFSSLFLHFLKQDVTTL